METVFFRTQSLPRDKVPWTRKLEFVGVMLKDLWNLEGSRPLWRGCGGLLVALDGLWRVLWETHQIHHRFYMTVMMWYFFFFCAPKIQKDQGQKYFILMRKMKNAEYMKLGKLFFVLFFFLGPHPWHMEIPRLGVQLELQLPAYTTATATPDPTRICDLHHSSRQSWILNPLSKAWDRTCILMDTSQICFHWATRGTLGKLFLISFSYTFLVPGHSLSFFPFLIQKCLLLWWNVCGAWSLREDRSFPVSHVIPADYTHVNLWLISVPWSEWIHP